MAENNNERKKKDAREKNPLLMIDPTVMGTPLGPLPIVPIPIQYMNDVTEESEKDDEEE